MEEKSHPDHTLHSGSPLMCLGCSVVLANTTECSVHICDLVRAQRTGTGLVGFTRVTAAAVRAHTHVPMVPK